MGTWFVVRYVGLILLLLLTLKFISYLNHLMDESFERKANLANFEKIYPELNQCWDNPRQLLVFLGCLTNDRSLLREVGFILTSCLLIKHHDHPIQCHGSMKHIFCQPESCPAQCARDESEKFLSHYGFNLWDAVEEGMRQKVCEATNPVDDEKAWNMGMPWENIMLNMGRRTTLDNRQQALIALDTPASEKIKSLKMLLRDSVFNMDIT